MVVWVAMTTTVPSGLRHHHDDEVTSPCQPDPCDVTSEVCVVIPRHHRRHCTSSDDDCHPAQFHCKPGYRLLPFLLTYLITGDVFLSLWLWQSLTLYHIFAIFWSTERVKIANFICDWVMGPFSRKFVKNEHVLLSVYVSGTTSPNFTTCSTHGPPPVAL